MNESLNSVPNDTGLCSSNVATLLKMKRKMCVHVNYDQQFLGHYFVWYFILKLFGFHAVYTDDLMHCVPFNVCQYFLLNHTRPWSFPITKITLS